jgi:hypothetical protein
MAEDHAEVWEGVLQRCREQAGLPGWTMALWLEPGQPLGIEDKRLVIAFPEYVAPWVATRYLSLLGELTREVEPSLAGIRIRKQPQAPSGATRGVQDG